MGLFDRWSRKSDKAHAYPWDRKPSIYEHVCCHLDREAGGLSEGGGTLPDDERIAQKSPIRWANGAFDGVWSHHVSKEASEHLQAAVQLIKDYCAAPTAANKLKVYTNVVEHHAIDIVDPLLEALGHTSRLNLTRLYEMARSFATEASDREPVKLGIALLGRLQQTQDRPVLLALGRHDEFTLYCAVALSTLSAAPEEDLWELARNVHGWGRVHVVERLAETDNPEIKRWLVREGYRNHVMYEYLACTCARAGNLRAELERRDVDAAMLTSAAEIIEALITGGPAENLDDYEDGAPVISAFLTHMQKRASEIRHLITVDAIAGWLSNDSADWSARAARGWSAGLREELLSSCREIARREMWRGLVLDTLSSGDETQFYLANRAAGFLGIDTWAYHWDRLQRSPGDSGRWWNVMHHCNADRIEGVLALARSVLPLDEIASGPADELGLGKAYRWHSCLGMILHQLGGYPGRGGCLVLVGLQSPVINNRNAALKALSQWGETGWPEGVRSALEQARAREPVAEVREAMSRVLSGGPRDKGGQPVTP